MTSFAASAVIWITVSLIWWIMVMFLTHSTIRILHQHRKTAAVLSGLLLLGWAIGCLYLSSVILYGTM